MLVLLGVIAIVVGVRQTVRGRATKRWRAWIALPIGGAVLIAIGAPRGMVLSKAIGILAMPIGLLWCATLAAALALWWRDRTLEAAIAGSFFVALTIVASPPIGGALLAFVEGEHGEVRTLSANHGRFDAIIVLGGGTGGRAHGEVQLGESGDRVALAARLYHRGDADFLVTAGAPIRGFSTHDSGRAAARIWRELGIPASAIVRVDGARTTTDEARLHSALIRDRGWRRVGLLTSAVHMERALALFEAHGADVVPLPADVRGRSLEWQGLTSLIPTGSAADDIHTASWEIVGRLAGR